MCFDSDASPSVNFQAPSSLEGDNSSGAPHGLYGWGIGWYPSSDKGASVVKDPTSGGDHRVSNALGDWTRFRSTIFVCHLRGHQRPRKQQDAQPFVRSYGGRQWIFAHDGDLAINWETRLPLPDDPAFDPLGRTDSEHAFCWLLARIHSRRNRTLADVEPTQLLAWFRQLNLGGQLNVILTDGEQVVVYRDLDARGQLHWTRRLPPHATTELSSDAVQISLSAADEANRTGLLFSSEPLSADQWTALEPGQLIIARRGSIVWNSETAKPDTPNEQASEPFVSAQSMTTAWSAGQFAPAQPFSAMEPLPPNRSTNFSELKHRNLIVTHNTRYEYDRPVQKSAHRFLMRPVEDRQQYLLNYSIEIEPTVTGIAFEDVFGNSTLGLEIDSPFNHLEITSKSSVSVYAVPPLEQRAAFIRTELPPVLMPWQRQMLSAYLLPPELPETQLQELSQFAASFAARNDYDLVGTLLDLNETLYRDFEYVSGSTTNETTAFQVFESRRGVCQDFANLMICLARLLQIPARYRMGYIFTSADYTNKIQSEASHAWVEVYIPRVGWHGFDPTNGIQVGADHVRVACGRNYLDATPTTGTIYAGGGTETLKVSVRVEEVSTWTATGTDSSSAAAAATDGTA
jgi:transglutaminase-like putative cysteine protease/predicted glutamine amidotransferase